MDGSEICDERTGFEWREPPSSSGSSSCLDVTECICGQKPAVAEFKDNPAIANSFVVMCQPCSSSADARWVLGASRDAAITKWNELIDLKRVKSQLRKMLKTADLLVTHESVEPRLRGIVQQAFHDAQEFM